MAIVFESQRKPVNWIKILFVVTTVLFVIFAMYYLFFAPTPAIDIVLPPPLEHTSKLVNPLTAIDPTSVLQSPAYRALQNYVGPPSLGILGRANPFAPF